MYRFLVIIATAFALTLNFSPTQVKAQDCDTLKQQIKKQRNLLKKKQLLDQALKSCAQDAEVHYLCAYSAERLRKYDQAVSQYLKATELDGSYAKAFFGLGDIYMILGNAKAAIKSFEKGLRLKPGNKRAKSSLDIARIKYKSESGSTITSEEFVRVMQESKKKATKAGAIDGPILRMQVQFQINSSQLSDKARQQLTIIGEALVNPALQGQRFEISGHTDNVGFPELNLQLSKDRAEQVKKSLVEKYSIPGENLTIAYFGDTRPIAPNTSAENRAMNRRVEFRKLKE